MTVIGRSGPVVAVDMRTCLWLKQQLDLRELRIRARSNASLPPAARAQITADLENITRLAIELEERFEATRTGRTEPTPKREQPTGLQWLSTRQAADLLGVGPRAVQQAIARGLLPAQKVGARWQVNRPDVEAYRAAHAA